MGTCVAPTARKSSSLARVIFWQPHLRKKRTSNEIHYYLGVELISVEPPYATCLYAAPIISGEVPILFLHFGTISGKS